MTTLENTPTANDDRWRIYAVVLALGTFVVGTNAFVIAGLLSSISNSLSVSVGAAGQLVTLFSLAYAVLAPVLATLTANWSRKTVLICALAVLAVGNAVTALAPDYGPVLMSRVISAAGAALYVATANATAATLAGEERRGRAISIVTLGLTSSLVLGAPLGTAIGAAMGWRATMWTVAALAVVVVPAIALWLPAGKQGSSARLRQRLAPLADRRILGVLLTTVVVFAGIYIPYTYISAIFDPATAGSGDRLAVLLVVFGVGATAGNIAAGYLADRYGPRRVILAVALILTAVFALLPVFRGEFAAALPAVVVAGALSFSVTAPQQHRIIAFAPEQAPVVTSLFQSALYLAISLSGVVGALGLRTLGAAKLPWLAAIFILVAAALTWWDGQRGKAVSRTQKT